MKQLAQILKWMIVPILVLCSYSAMAARGGGGIRGDHSIGFGASIISSSQKDINDAITTANASATGPISSKSLGSAYEFYFQYVFRFSGTMFGLVFRPSYFTQSSTGTGTDGNYDYKLTGYTFFPLIRVYPLENAFFKFFFQGGVGFGKLNVDMTTGSGNNVAFDGSNFGSQAGLGVDFCFTGNHCLTIEGNVRYLPIERNIASSTSGTIVGIDNPINKGDEVESQRKDLATTMSGIQGVLAYTYIF